MLEVVYFTDPLCPWSWGAEPVIRRMQAEFAGRVTFTYVMVGIAREVDPGPKLAATLDVAAESGMPADARIWLEGTPRSSHPACLAVKAAAEQGLDEPYLRRLREGIFLRRERVDNPDALLAAARDVAGLDASRLDIDMRSNAMVEVFGADRERAFGACGNHRPSVPAFTVGEQGPIGPTELPEAITASGGEPGPLPAIEDALARFGAMATAEVAAVCGLPMLRASVELWRLAGEFRVRPEPLAFGELWRPA